MITIAMYIIFAAMITIAVLTFRVQPQSKLRPWVLIQSTLFVLLFTLSFFAKADIELPNNWKRDFPIPIQTDNDVLTDELTDLECVAYNIYWEARGEDEIGQSIVAQITINRINHPKFPNTACSVITQINRHIIQFEWTQDGRSDRPHNITAYRQNYLMAFEFLYLGKQAPVPEADKLLFFHSTRDRTGRPFQPNWFWATYAFTHGGHHIYKEKEESI